MKWIIPLFILIFFEFVADIFSKEWSLQQNKIWLAVGGLAAYMLANTFWLFALKNGSGLTRGAIIFSVSSAVIATLLGVFFYHETITKIQFIGVLLGLISLVLIFWE